MRKSRIHRLGESEHDDFREDIETGSGVDLLVHLRLVPSLPPDDGRDEEQRPARKRPEKVLPNGMLHPDLYGVWRGQWFRAGSLGNNVYTLHTPDLERPGEQWYGSRETDEMGRPWFWNLDVSRPELDRLVAVGVGAKWRGYDLSIFSYTDGMVKAQVFVEPGQAAAISRREVPEITFAGPSEYYGTFRWEDLEDIRTGERDLVK